MASIAPSSCPEWLDQAVIYQIYPQSFCDSNADGIGDLKGIISKLGYLKEFGVDCIWLNPCFDSPFHDAGYDVRDFYKIAPRYGTHADMQSLCREAHKLGIRVCLDLVAGHTSWECEWFKQSCSGTKNKYWNRYVWADQASKDHGPQFISGWGDRQAAYLSNYYFHQPALNYGYTHPKEPWQLPMDHPDAVATREELKRIMAFWMDRGVDGFRVDMASSLVKGHRRGVMQLWKHVRGWFSKKYPEGVLMSEWSVPSEAVPAGFHIDFFLHFNSTVYHKLFGVSWQGQKRTGLFDASGKGSARAFLDEYLPHYQKARRQGYSSLVAGNHDVPRLSPSRSTEELKVIYTFLMTMPGVPVIYYGDEIGMRYVEGLPSKEGAYHRAGSRTPMQWDSSKNAGFSKAPASQLYLPLDSSRDRPTVASQIRDRDSLYHFIRELIVLRRKHPAFRQGAFEPLHAKAKGGLLAYERKQGRERFVVVLNPSGKPLSGKWPQRLRECERVAGRGVELIALSRQVEARVKPFGYAVFRVR